MSDGLAKNLERVVEGFEAVWADWLGQNSKVRAAWGRGDYRRVLHFLRGYRSALLHHAYRFWDYTWELKWLLVSYLIWGDWWTGLIG